MVCGSLLKTMEDRVDNANVLFDKINFPVNFFIDTMTNQACNAFGALPERLAVILDGKIEFLGGTGPIGYSIPELENYLMKYKGRKLIKMLERMTCLKKHNIVPQMMVIKSSINTNEFSCGSVTYSSRFL